MNDETVLEFYEWFCIHELIVLSFELGKGKSMDNKVEVSICCITYNHEKYIRETLDSFIMQITNFRYEVLIHDDASTDGTDSIIREYEEKYPEIIKPIYQKENQYSKGVSIMETFQRPRIHGKYVALCEGDDYWTDPYKLQKQYDAMEECPEVDMSAHAANTIKNGQVESIISRCNKKCIIKPDKVILGGGGYFATNSLFYRSSIYSNIPEFYKFLHFDYTLQIWGSLRGGILYLPDNMSAYRLAVEGSWTNRISDNKEKFVLHLKRKMEMLEILNDETEGKYKKAINRAMDEIWFRVVEITKYPSEYKLDDYLTHLRYLSGKERLKRIYRFVKYVLKRMH